MSQTGGYPEMRNESRTTPATLRWFYDGLAGVLLLCVAAGFAPSSFLRPVFTSKPLPAYLYLHGGVLTIWFGLLFAQSWLVAAHRAGLHRRLGVMGALNATALVPLSAWMVIRAIPRYVSAGVPPAEIQFIVIGDLISLAIFSILVASALVWRRHRDWHRRLMIVASIMIIGPAIARFERLGLAIPVPASPPGDDREHTGRRAIRRRAAMHYRFGHKPGPVTKEHR